MVEQMLTTKLFAPPHRTDLVSRPRLLKILTVGVQRKVTLLSAPAGFGKTTLVSEWLGQLVRPAAWLSLDADDSDLARFLTHLVAALQTVAPGVGESVRASLRAPQLPPTSWLITELLNDIASFSEESVLVLDDYHLLDSEAVSEALNYLLDHLPQQLHLVITTREDPELRLADMRVKGQLTELRAADLRFSEGEVADLLNRVMALGISAADIALLTARTEGWIAGLHLAALSMQGREDLPGFITTFAGDHRYVVDYLVEEILKRQAERVRDFLLQTSVLNRLNGPLCDAVVAQEGGAELLHSLERANLFLVPLDDTRHWYRYHHLFREVLRAHLEQRHGDLVATLHRRASAWYESCQMPTEAIRHALAGRDFERAAEMISRQWRAMDSTVQSEAWASWVDQLPEAIVRERPVLVAGYAWAQLNTGALEAADRYLREVEAWLASADSIDRPNADQPAASSQAPDLDDEQELHALPGTVVSARAYLALASGEPAASVAHAQQALTLLSADDHVRRGIPLGILSLAHWANGDLREAHDILAAALAGFRASGMISAAISCTFGLAEILVTQGRLRRAARLYQDAFRFVEESASADAPGVAELHLGLGDVSREQGDLAAAERHLRTVEELGNRAVLTGDLSRVRTVMAKLEASLGNSERALTLLDEADQLAIRSPMPDLQPVAARRALIWLAQGRVDEAASWAHEHDLKAEDQLSFMREFEHLVLARLLLAVGRLERSRDLLDRARSLLGGLLVAAEEGGRSGRVIEILVLQSLVSAATGDERAAARSLSRALTLAEPEGYVRVFLDEGAPMTALLQRLKRGDSAARYAGVLLAFGGDAVSPALTAHSALDSLEALTERESQVLRLLGTDLSGPEIARELRVSLNTVRTHVRNVYGKLGANGRRAAVSRAKELGLLQ